jgi:hypothetical protein
MFLAGGPVLVRHVPFIQTEQEMNMLSGERFIGFQPPIMKDYGMILKNQEHPFSGQILLRVCGQR